MFIDVLRLIAAVQMVQGHSVASVLAPAYQSGPGFVAWTFARGLTSVLFLCTAGLSFVLAERRGCDARARRRRAFRALRLIGIGYLMHAPFAVMWGAPLKSALAAAMAVDVLQCIGVSLLVLELITFGLAQARARAALSCGLGVLCFAAAPASAALELGGASMLVGNYFTARHGSLFPLVPWAGYVLLGFGLGTSAFADAGGQRGRPATVLVLAGMVSGITGAFAMLALPALPRALSPGYCALKLGLVLLLAGLLAQALRAVRRLPTLLERLAGETLFLYVSHVVILYADGIGLEQRLRGTRGPGFGLLLALALLLLCSAAALVVRSLQAQAGGGTRAASS